jgi:hypothetical protein
MLYTIFAVTGLAILTCIGLLRALEELIDAKTNLSDEKWHDQ